MGVDSPLSTVTVNAISHEIHEYQQNRVILRSFQFTNEFPSQVVVRLQHADSQQVKTII